MTSVAGSKNTTILISNPTTLDLENQNLNKALNILGALPIAISLVPLILTTTVIHICLKIFNFPTNYLPNLPNFQFNNVRNLTSDIYQLSYDLLLPPSSKTDLPKLLSISAQGIIFLSSLFAIVASITYSSLFQLSNLYNYYKGSSEHLDENLNCNEFDKDNFLKGTATCTYQDTGGLENSQWHKWESKIIADEANRSTHSGKLFTLYQNNLDLVIQKLKRLNVNSYRFSVEWSHLQPEKDGAISQEILNVYIQLCTKLKENNIKPMVTLHHFSEPLWFHKLGSFEKEENIQYFVNFSKEIVKALKNNVDYFCTINEPNVEAFSRYVRGVFSPGITFNFSKGLQFLKYALKAHQAVYKMIKDEHPQAKVGFSHQYLKFISGNFLLTPVTDILTRFVNDITLKVLSEKKLSLQIPFLINHEEDLEIDNDFVGVQYYVRPIIGLTGSTNAHYGEPMTQMPFREDPEGLYEAITQTHRAANKPIMVTENGISTHDHEQRKRYLENALKALIKAKKELKSNLSGYFLWAFTQNFEWDMGMNPQNFGAYPLINQNGKIEIADDPSTGVSPFQKFLK